MITSRSDWFMKVTFYIILFRYNTSDHPPQPSDDSLISRKDSCLARDIIQEGHLKSRVCPPDLLINITEVRHRIILRRDCQ
jgi:hypothetical protein